MPSYYDDNFGFYEIESEDDIEFYHRNQKRSVLKKCQACGRKVRLLPDYAYCNSCVNKLENGFDVDY